MAKNTYKFNLQKTLRSKPTGIVENSITLKDTKDLYELIVSYSIELDTEELKLLIEKQDHIVKLHTAKFANEYEKLLNDFDEDKDGNDDGFVFEFVEEDLLEAYDDGDNIAGKDELDLAVENIGIKYGKQEDDSNEELKPIRYKRKFKSSPEMMPIDEEIDEFLQNLLEERPRKKLIGF